MSERQKRVITYPPQHHPQCDVHRARHDSVYLHPPLVPREGTMTLRPRVRDSEGRVLEEQMGDWNALGWNWFKKKRKLGGRLRGPALMNKLNAEFRKIRK